MILLDIRGWVSLHASDAARAMINNGAAISNGSSAASPATPEPQAGVASTAAVEAGLSNVAGGVTSAANGTRDMPANEDVAAGVAAMAEGVKEGGMSAKVLL